MTIKKRADKPRPNTDTARHQLEVSIFGKKTKRTLKGKVGKSSPPGKRLVRSRKG